MLLDDLATYLDDAGLVTLGTNFFKGVMMPTPDICAAIVEYAGESPEKVQETRGITYERARVQLMVRGEPMGYENGRTLMQSLYLELSKIENMYLGTTWYLRAVPIQTPFLLDRDENDRPLFAVNFMVHRAVG